MLRAPRPIVAAMLSAAALAVAVGTSCAGRLAGPAVCSQATPCGKGYGCVLGRCRSDKTVPVATLAPRLTFEPVDLVWIGAEGKRTPADADDALILGPSAAPTTLLVRFAVSVPAPPDAKKAKDGKGDDKDDKKTDDKKAEEEADKKRDKDAKEQREAVAKAAKDANLPPEQVKKLLDELDKKAKADKDKAAKEKAAKEKAAKDKDEVPLVQRALLVLEPLPACDAHAGQLTVELAAVLEPWTSARVGPRSLPRMGLPALAGVYPMAPPQPLRVDVTEMVREWANHPGSGKLGIAIVASSSSDAGACYASGAIVGRGPRLEVYLPVPEPPKKEGAGGAGGAGGAKGQGGAGGAEEEEEAQPTGEGT